MTDVKCVTYATRLPAAPLLALVERMLANEPTFEEPLTEARASLYERVGLHERVLYKWRRIPSSSVSTETADRILSLSPYLWWDVWLKCPTHRQAARGCDPCRTYYKARHIFTGAPIPIRAGVRRRVRS